MSDQLIFSKNPLFKIASDEGYPYAPGIVINTIDGEQEQISPSWNKGQLYFATKDDDKANSIEINGKPVSIGHHKAYIYLDDNDNQKRYYVTSPIDWTDLLNKPLNEILSNLTMNTTLGKLHELQLHYLDDVNDVKGTLSLPFVLLSGDTMTGPLSIAQDATATGSLKKVTLDYNGNTESLDFTFN